MHCGGMKSLRLCWNGVFIGVEIGDVKNTSGRKWLICQGRVIFDGWCLVGWSFKVSWVVSCFVLGLFQGVFVLSVLFVGDQGGSVIRGYCWMTRGNMLSSTSKLVIYYGVVWVGGGLLLLHGIKFWACWDGTVLAGSLFHCESDDCLCMLDSQLFWVHHFVRFEPFLYLLLRRWKTGQMRHSLLWGRWIVCIGRWGFFFLSKCGAN